MFEPHTVAMVLGAFLVGGLVKGTVGLGLPTVAIAILATTVGVKPGLALMLAPAIFTNIWQGLVGGQFRPIFTRLWTLYVTLVIAIFLGVEILARADAGVLRGILGAFLIVYSGINLATPQIPAPPERHERWLSPVMGFCSGLLCGLTGTLVVPGVLYMQALGMRRDVLIQAMGVAFTIGTVSLATAMTLRGLVTMELGGMSLLALIPSFAGLFAGQWIRRRIPEAKFRRVFFVALALLGVYLVSRAFL